MKKKISIYLTLSGLLLFGNGCNDFIDKEPPLYVNEGDVYSNPARIENALSGLYASMKNAGSTYALVGGKGYAAMDARGNDIVNVSSNNVELLDVYNMAVNDVYADNTHFWTYSYLTINRVNVFLAGIDGAKELLGTSLYNQYRSEALFVRAMCYYYLNNLYGKPYILDSNAKSVPLRLLPELTAGNNSMPASTVAQVYDQVLSDLSDANISALPDTKNDYTTVTRATKAAANMLKMRVYMSQSKWTEAISAGEAITGYALAADVAATFKPPYFNKESIFSLPMAQNNRPNTQLSLPEFYNSANDILLVDTEAGILSKANYSLAIDARVKSFVGDNKRLLKYTDVANKLDWVPVFRYAETLLNLAECYASPGGSNNEAKAKELLKLVRNRSVDPNQDPLKIDQLSGSSLIEAISDERRLELIGEGVRGIDITRKGETFKKGAGANYFEVKPTDVGYLWPIPASEKLSNPGL
ncbi:MAG: RagB/SusD family nutrient uptake outer membrane protein [Prevotella sp.]|jgi:hypothetical protein|nr:RagB/SusD family nutrient uptake outer membrane protein [Prevotella sp.]